jgi:hypothetical protein
MENTKRDVKVGDQVRLLVGTDDDSSPFQKGTICTIYKIVKGTTFPYFLTHPEAGALEYARTYREQFELLAPQDISQFHPKEGEIVWHVQELVKKKVNANIDGKLFILSNQNEAIFLYDGQGTWLDVVEPYTHQDVQLPNFSAVGLILSDGDFIVETGGEADECVFRAKPIGGEVYEKFRISDRWKDITKEASKLLEELRELYGKL